MNLKDSVFISYGNFADYYGDYLKEYDTFEDGILPRYVSFMEYAAVVKKSIKDFNYDWTDFIDGFVSANGQENQPIFPGISDLNFSIDFLPGIPQNLSRWKGENIISEQYIPEFLDVLNIFINNPCKEKFLPLYNWEDFDFEVLETEAVRDCVSQRKFDYLATLSYRCYIMRLASVFNDNLLPIYNEEELVNLFFAFNCTGDFTKIDRWDLNKLVVDTFDELLLVEAGRNFTPAIMPRQASIEERQIADLYKGYRINRNAFAYWLAKQDLSFQK